MTSEDRKEIESSKISRRGFFKMISGILSGFIAAAMAVPMVETIIGTVTKKNNELYTKVAPLDAIPGDQPVNLSFVMTQEDAFIKNIVEHKVWTVKKSDIDINVFSPICPHLGCRYQWHPDRHLFICPCHHSVFNIDGKVISGPAPRSLDTLPKKIENNDLFVLWERFKPGITRKERI